MLTYYSKTSTGRVYMDPDFIFFINFVQAKIRNVEEETALSEVLLFILEHQHEDALQMLSQDQSIIFNDKFVSRYVINKPCDICGLKFTWKDHLFVRERVVNGQPVPYHPYCLIRESY